MSVEDATILEDPAATHLGDGLHASYNGDWIWLHYKKNRSKQWNEIPLSPDGYRRLISYAYQRWPDLTTIAEKRAVDLAMAKKERLYTVSAEGSVDYIRCVTDAAAISQAFMLITAMFSEGAYSDPVPDIFLVNVHQGNRLVTAFTYMPPKP